jgi:hypothetical protein
LTTVVVAVPADLLAAAVMPPASAATAVVQVGEIQ